MVYRASRDPRVVASKAAAAIFLFLAGALQVETSPGLGAARVPMLICGVALVALAATVGAAAAYVRYELTRFDLVVRSGFRVLRIPLECIEGVLPVQHALDAPRPRPPHITIVYQKRGHAGAAIVMPEDPELFLRDLAAGAPFLEKMGDRLLRKPGLLVES